MVAQSISGGVRSLMRTLYKPAATEKENDIEIPPAKRRRTEKEYVKRDEGHQNHHSMTKPQNGIAAQRRISSRTRRERNYADHDGNEGEGLGERSNQENEGDDEYPVAGLREGDLEVSRYSKRMRQRNNADHSGNGSESNTGYTIGIVKDFKGYLVASPKKFKDTLRQSSRIRNNGNNADLNGFDEIDMDGKMAKNIEFNKGYSSNYTLEPLASQRPSSRSRPKRNDVDHITNEEDASEGHNDDSNSEYGLHSETNQRKGSKRRTSTDMCHKAMSADSVRNDEEKYNEDLNEGNPAKRLVGRSRRKRNQADHQGNEMEDANLTKLQNGDIRSPTTPTKRLRSRQANDGRLNSAGSGILTSSDKPGITLSSRKILPKSRSEENYRIDTNVFPGQSNPDKAQSSPLSAGRRNQQSHRKDTSLKTPNNSLTHSMNNGRDSPFISENFISGVARKSELLTDATAVSFLRGVLRDRLTCNRSTKLIGIDTEYEKVYRLIEQTVSAGEGNSVLLIGTRGCGKSAIVCKALEEVSREHSQAFYTIRLNGFFLTDDRIALREIWRQLGQEMEVEDETSGKNYADTLSKLLALLSHSTETDNGDSAATQKSLIFIMEEFDQFTSHPRQTLLYNLLDVAQSQKAPIAVIGMTTRIDIAESMEKRVKSRFSHRYIHIPLAKNYDTFKTVCRANLECNSENLSPQELMQFSKYKKSIGKAKKNQKGSHDDFLKKWNSQVSKLIDEPSVDRFLRQKYNTSKSAPAAINALSASLFDSGNFLGLTKEQSRVELLGYLNPPESKLIFLPHLPTLALALLISAARLDIVLDTDTVNFSMVYEEYSNLAGKARIESAAGGAITAGASTKVWSREVAIREWDRLVSYGFLLPLQGTVAPFGMYRVDVALEEIAPSVPDLDRVLEKWCKQI